MICLLLPSAGVASAQTGAAAPATASLGAGWSAFGTGRYGDAVAAADAVLARRPFDHGAIILKVQSLAHQRNVQGAFKAYDEWRTSRRADDPQLVASIAEAVLQDIAISGAVIDQRLEALRVLTSAGDADARRALTRLAATSGAAGAVALARAGLGNPDKLLGLLKAPGPKAEVIDALAKANPPGTAEAVAPLLADPDPMTKTAAASALASIGAQDAVPALKSLLSDPMPLVSQAAALSLVKLGDQSAAPVIDQMLSSGVPDIVLNAAEAMPDQPSRWQVAVDGLLDTENPVDRLRAARLLKDIRPDAARAVVTAGLGDSNLAIREEAARAIDTIGLPDNAPEWPKMLSDPSTWVRLEGARALFLGEARREP